MKRITHGLPDNLPNSPCKGLTHALEGHTKITLIHNFKLLLGPPIVLGLFMAVLFGTVSLFM